MVKARKNTPQLQKPLLSKKVVEDLYRQIHTSITDLRIELKDKIPSGVDFTIAQVEIKMWQKMKPILRIP